MERDQWMREYSRLCVAYGRKPNAEQASVYFTALSLYPSLVVAEAVTAAIRSEKTWPNAADLVALAREARVSRTAPSSVCDVCHGDGWVIETLPPVMVSFPPGRRGEARTEAREWSPQQARRCYQCRPTTEAA